MSNSGSSTSTSGHSPAPDSPSAGRGEPDHRLSSISFTDLILSSDEFLIESNQSGYACPVQLPDDYHEDARRLLNRAREKEKRLDENEFNLRYDDVLYRVTTMETLLAKRYSFRRPISTVPSLKNFPVKEWIRDEIMDPDFYRNGGFMVVSGPTDAGKTTLVGSYLTTVLRENGGYGITIEDPPELSLEQYYGQQGLLHQTKVEKSYEQSINRMKRTADLDFMMLGECRDPETIQTAIKSGIHGPFVLTTIHSKSLLETLDNLAGAYRNDDELYDQLSRGVSGFLFIRYNDQTERREIRPLLVSNQENEKKIRRAIAENNRGRIKTFINNQGA